MNPVAEYETAVLEFVERVLLGRRSDAFRRTFEPFVQRVAWLGMLNMLSQLGIKLTMPGVPDFYQGTELWDLNLVDPDNRRPIDFGRRAEMLRECRALHEAHDPAAVRCLLDRWEDGRIKLYVTMAGLHLRRRYPDVFLSGEYLPLTVAGERAKHLVAFARRRGSHVVVVAAPRLLATLTGESEAPPLGEAAWGGTTLVLPDGTASHQFTDALTGATLRGDAEGRVPAAEMFKHLPVGIVHSG